LAVLKGSPTFEMLLEFGKAQEKASQLVLDSLEIKKAW
jgi:hypothetical protein